jgi:hypothetical protein
VKLFLNINGNNINSIIAILILPSLVLPIKYSSLILIIASIASIYNLRTKSNKKLLICYLLSPFILYFFSVLISFFIDIYINLFDLDFVLRNLIILIIPLFIFTSNFSKPQILNILKKTSVLITIIGLFLILSWVFGYYKYDNQQEYQKEEWFKKDIIITKDYLTKNAILNVVIESGSEMPSFRKVIMLTNEQITGTVVREFIVKNKDIKNDIWVLIRNVDDGNCKAWFNIKTGEIGKVEGDVIVRSEMLSDGFFRFIHANKPKANATREWFYISIVSENGAYRWNNNLKKDVHLQLKNPNLYLDSGENLLKTKNFFKYKNTEFNGLKNYAHSTYLGLVFLFALIVFVFNSFVKNWIRVFVIIVNILVIVTLSSKAIAISFFFLLPLYYLYNYFNYKYLTLILAFGIFLTYNGHVKGRFNEMFQTIANLNQDKDLGDLKGLSTNNRIHIYKNYFDLVKSNYMIGHGYKNGFMIVNSKFNHNFNAHNQYLQALFHSGTIGFFSLILFSISPFIFKRKKIKNKYGFEFLICLILFNFLFESLLFRQWGLIYVSFIYAVYFQFYKKDFKWFR